MKRILSIFVAMVLASSVFAADVNVFYEQNYRVEVLGNGDLRLTDYNMQVPFIVTKDRYSQCVAASGATYCSTTYLDSLMSDHLGFIKRNNVPVPATTFSKPVATDNGSALAAALGAIGGGVAVLAVSKIRKKKTTPKK